MKQARYDAESLGHFGLAAEFYTHFTSPIRRYPDLVIHRVIREVLAGGGRLSDARMEKLAERMPDIARQSSERERAAQEAERETDDLKKAEYMLDKIGEEYEGIISGVTSFGMFVMLPNTVEGLIRLSDLQDDYYHYHELQHSLIGERTSKVYRIGDEVKVRVARVSVAEHTIDFELVETRRREKTVSLVDDKPARRRGKEGRGGRAAEPGRGRRTGSDAGGTGNGGRSGGGSVGRSGKGGRGSAASNGKGGGRSGKSSSAASFITVWTGSNGGNASAGSGGNGGRKRGGGKNGGGGARKRGR